MIQEGARRTMRSHFWSSLAQAGPELHGLETKIKQIELKTKLVLAQVSGWKEGKYPGWLVFFAMKSTIQDNNVCLSTSERTRCLWGPEPMPAELSVTTKQCTRDSILESFVNWLITRMGVGGDHSQERKENILLEAENALRWIHAAWLSQLPLTAWLSCLLKLS